MELLPTQITICGLSLGLLGTILWPRPIGMALLLVSLALDVVDGAVARFYEVTSELGGKIDWWTDIAIGNAIVIAMAHNGRIDLVLPSVIALTFMQALTAWCGLKTSGRAIVTAIAMTPLLGL